MWLRIAAYFPIVFSNKPLSVRHFEIADSVWYVGLPEIISPLEASLATIEKDPSLSYQRKNDVRRYVAQQRLEEIALLHSRGKRDVAASLLREWRRQYGTTCGWLGCYLTLGSPAWLYQTVRKCRSMMVGLACAIMQLFKKHRLSGDVRNR
jgi:hypothetical protein